MAEELHAFLTGKFWLRLKDDVKDLRVFNKPDLVAAAYFHIRRLLLILPGWRCRVSVQLGPDEADLILLHNNSILVVLQLESLLLHGDPSYLPTERLDESMRRLRQMVTETTGAGRSRGYLVGVFDSPEPWFFPEEAEPEKQTSFWLPVNCRDFPNYPEWRQRWERLARL
ncbi:MAG: hypothetical protein ABIK44_03975 [candidate division WOR-3 bacterium]